MYRTRANSMLANSLRWTAITMLLLAITPSTFAKKKKEATKQEPAKPKFDMSQLDTTKLVWPQPPDIARVRWIEQYSGEPPKEQEEQKKKPKRSWMDRMAGAQVQDNKQANVTHILARPFGVGFDSKGRIYVADSYVSAVFIFNPADKKTVESIRNGHEAKFGEPVGLAIDDNDRLFVVDAKLGRVNVFDPTRKFETAFGQDVLSWPTGAAIDVENRLLYVVDTKKECVMVFDADSYKFLRRIGGPAKVPTATDPGTFARPTNVAVDGEGNVYVSDTINNRVQIFDADGNFISMFGKHGDSPGFFARPKGIAVDSDGHIWVADAVQDNVQIYDREGKLLGFVGTHGVLPGQFLLATGVAINKDGRVVVAAQFSGRAQVFQDVTDAEAAAVRAERDKANAPAKNTAEVKQ